MHHTPNSSAYCLHTYAHAHTHTHARAHTHTHTHSHGDSRIGQFLIPLLYSLLQSSNAEKPTCFWPVLSLGTNCFRLLGCSLPQARMLSCSLLFTHSGSLPGPLLHTLNATQVRVRETTHKAHTYISQFNIWCDKQVHPSIMQSYKDTLGITKRLGTKTTEKDQAT